MHTTIHGIAVYNMGINNYSEGMELLIFNPKDISYQEVSKLPNIFLNPTAEPNSMEIFAVGGTQKQFDEFYKRQRLTWATKKAYNRLQTYSFTIENEPEFNEFKAWYQ